MKSVFFHSHLLRTRKSSWILALVFSFYLLASAPFIPFVAGWLRAHLLLKASLILLALVFLTYLLAYFLHQLKIRKILAYVDFLLIILFAVLLMRNMFSLEERIHFLEYALLALLFFKAAKFDFGGSPKHGSLKLFLIPLFLTGTVGIVEELFQGLLPNRVYDPWDIFYNVTGGVLGLLLAWVRERYVP